MFLVPVNWLFLMPAWALAAEARTAGIEGLDGVRVVRSQMIWDAAPHNAFTDLTRWEMARPVVLFLSRRRGPQLLRRCGAHPQQR